MNTNSNFNISSPNILTISRQLNTNESLHKIIHTCKQLIFKDIFFLETFFKDSYLYYQDIQSKKISKKQAIQYIHRIPCFYHENNFSFYIRNKENPPDNIENPLIIQIKNNHLSQEIFIFLYSDSLTSDIIHNTHFLILLNLFKLYFANTAYLHKNLIENLNPFYKSLAEQAPLLINIIGSDLKFTLWNRECEQVFGWKLTDLQAMSNELIHLFSDHVDYKNVKRFFSNRSLNASKLYEFSHICKYGSALTTLWTSIALPNQFYINVGINITEQRKSEKLLKERANIDLLTQCFNRMAIFEELDIQLKQCRDQDMSFCVFLIDIDHFKLVNDIWGHIVGDKALQHFVHLLQLNQNHKIHVGRFGGEEFIVILETEFVADAFAFDAQMRLTLSKQPLYEKQQQITLNYSGGFTLIKKGICSRNSLLSSIDEALYRAKKHGRGRTYQSHTTY